MSPTSAVSHRIQYITVGCRHTDLFLQDDNNKTGCLNEAACFSKETVLKYTHIFWDFNGTILSDMQAGMDSVNKMLADRDLPVIPDIESYRRIFDFPIIEYYRGLGFDFDREPYEVLAPIWVELYNILKIGIYIEYGRMEK